MMAIKRVSNGSLIVKAKKEAASGFLLLKS